MIFVLAPKIYLFLRGFSSRMGECRGEFFAVFLFVLVKMIKTTVLWWNFEFTGGKTAFSRASRLSDGRFDERAAHTRPERCACNHESGQLCSAASAVYAR